MDLNSWDTSVHNPKSNNQNENIQFKNLISENQDLLIWQLYNHTLQHQHARKRLSK